MSLSQTLSRIPRPRLLLRLVTGVILLLLFVEAIHLRFGRMPDQPISDHDTWGYLSPSIAHFTIDQFRVSYRSFPYPGLLLLILESTHRFSSIVTVQNLISLGGGIILGLAWLKLRRFLPERPAIVILHTALGLLLLTTWLLAARHVLMEHLIRPEPVFVAFSALQLWLELSLLEAAFVSVARRKALVFTFFTVFNTLLLYLLKPEWGLALGVALLPPLFVLLKCSWRLKTITAGGAAALCFLVFFWLPEKAFQRKYSPEANFLPSLLFCVHANLIEQEIELDLASPAQPPYPRDFLETVSSQVKYALSNPPASHVYRSLGFDPDYILYRAPTLPLIRTRLGSADAFAGFCYHYYAMAWLHQPSKMAHKILREMHLFYRLDSEVSESGKARYKLDEHYATALEVMQQSTARDTALAPWPPLQDYIASLQKLSTTTALIRQHSSLARIFATINSTFLPASAIMLLGLLLWCLIPKIRQTETFSTVHPLVLGAWLFSFNLGMTLTVSIVHSMKVGRFTQVQMTYTLFSYFAAILLLAAWLMELKKRSHGNSLNGSEQPRELAKNP